MLGFFGDKFLGTECTLEAETSASNLTQYKLFIGVDKKKDAIWSPFKLNLRRLHIILHEVSSIYHLVSSHITMTLK